VRKQSTVNRQGGDEPIDGATAEQFLQLGRQLANLLLHADIAFIEVAAELTEQCGR
jgi:hypothetical protein